MAVAGGGVPSATLKALYGDASTSPAPAAAPSTAAPAASLGTAVNPSYPQPWANRITRWRANPGSLGKIGHRSETGAR